jgi:hypothetical protein
MGAGRSGTTILATVLGGVKEITTLGEMHQFLDHLLNKNPCSCGEQLNDCHFWSPIVANLQKKYTKEDLIKINNHNIKVENHNHIIKSLISSDKKYVTFQQELIALIKEQKPSEYYLDSAKYISRALQLSKIKGLNVKIVYLVRDVRGVINSFGKKVQTTKSPLSTIVYYSVINFFGQWVYWILGKKKVLKLRYEDFVETPRNTLNQIQNFAACDMFEAINKLESNEPFNMPHIIGGNRMTEKSSVKLKSDLQWKKNISRPKQMAYYFLTLPFMLLNKYKI